MSELIDLATRGPFAPYLRLAAIAFGAHLTIVLFRTWIVTRLERLAARSETRIDDVLVAGIAKIGFLTTLGVTAYTAGYSLNLPAPAQRALLLLGGALLIVQVGRSADRALAEAVAGWRDTAGDDRGRATVATGIGYLARVGVWSIVILAVLSNMGVEISALLAGLGVGGIAAALAIRAALSDVIAAVTIYFDRPFDIGDSITVGTFSGTVEKIGLRSTKVRAATGELLVFSNTDLTANRIQNFRRMTERRITVRLAVVYDTPHETLVRIPDLTRQAVEAVAQTRFDRCHFLDYGDSALLFELVYWVTSPESNVAFQTRHGVNLGVHQRFTEAGVRFAYPTQTVLLAKE